MALLNKATSGGGGGGGSHETAKLLEQLLMRERAKNAALMRQIDDKESSENASEKRRKPDYGAGKMADLKLQQQIRQTVIAEDMLMEANRSVARLEKSEKTLKVRR